MTATLTTIARTISDELERAVAAAEEAQNAGLDGVMRDLEGARRKRAEALFRVEEMQKEAATIIAEAMKLRERTESEFSEAMDGIMFGVTSLKVPERVRVNGSRTEALPVAEQVEGDD